MITLQSIYKTVYPNRYELLYGLLAERTPDQSISHKAMPTWDEHVKFVTHNPYKEWNFIYDNNQVVGAVYVTEKNEIGLGIFKRYQGRGYATRAVKIMKARHGKLYANINPANEASIKLFKKFGAQHIQNTYEF